MDGWDCGFDSPIAPWDMVGDGESSDLGSFVIADSDVNFDSARSVVGSDSEGEAREVSGGTYAEPGRGEEPVIGALDVRRVLLLRELLRVARLFSQHW
jgi:hypothetical protein